MSLRAALETYNIAVAAPERLLSAGTGLGDGAGARAEVNAAEPSVPWGLKITFLDPSKFRPASGPGVCTKFLPHSPLHTYTP